LIENSYTATLFPYAGFVGLSPGKRNISFG